MLTTDLSDHLVRKGVPFREAHHVAGAVVKMAEQRSPPLLRPPRRPRPSKNAHPSAVAACCVRRFGAEGGLSFRPPVRTSWRPRILSAELRGGQGVHAGQAVGGGPADPAPPLRRRCGAAPARARVRWPGLRKPPTRLGQQLTDGGVPRFLRIASKCTFRRPRVLFFIPLFSFEVGTAGRVGVGGGGAKGSGGD